MNVTGYENQMRGNQQPSEVPEGALPAFHPLRVLVRRRWQLLACLLVVCSVAFAATTFREPKYEAVAKVHITNQGSASGGGASWLVGRGGSDYFNMQCELLQSRRVLARAAGKLHMTGEGWIYSEEGLRQLRDSLKVKPLPSAGMVEILGIGDTATKAAAIANHVTAAFIETAEADHRSDNARTMERFHDQIVLCDQEIETLEAKVAAFRREHLITGADDSVAVTERRIQLIEQELSEVSLNIANLQSRRDKIANSLSGGPGGGEVLFVDLAKDAAVNTLEQTIEQLEDKERQLSRTYLPGHQKLSGVRDRLADLRIRLNEARNRCAQMTYSQSVEQLSSLQMQTENLVAQLQEQRRLGVDLTERNQKYRKMLADLDRTSRFREDSEVRMRQYMLEVSGHDSPIEVVDAANVPTNLAGLSKAHQAGAILLLGVLFSVVFVFAFDRLALSPEVPSMAVQPIYVPVPAQANNGWAWPSQQSNPAAQQAQEGSDWPESSDAAVGQDWLGKIDRIALGGDNQDDKAFASRCRLVQMDSACSAAVGFRDLARRLLARFGNSRQGIVITGTQAGSGKSTCACNLAILLARSGRKVLLVDADVENASLKRVFSSDTEKPGLSDMLAEPGTVAESVQESEFEGLMWLAQGARVDWSGQTSEQIDALHNELKRRCDWVIYDAGTMELDFTKSLLGVVGKAITISDTLDVNAHVAAVESVERCGSVSVGVVANTPLSSRQWSEQSHKVRTTATS